MAFHISAPTDVVIFLVGVKDARGVLRFPTKNNYNPGVVFRTNRKIPVNEQLINETQVVTGLSGLNVQLQIEQNFSADVTLPNGDSATLYVGIIHDYEGLISEAWKSLPEILRNMPRDKNRVSYLKAWQVLMGGLTQDSKVVEAEDVSKAMLDHYESASETKKDPH